MNLIRRLVSLEGDKPESRFQCRLLGLFYEDLIVPILKMKGYKILAGERKNGGIIRPRVYRCGRPGQKERPKLFDYLLEKGNQFFLVEAKCWPSFHPIFNDTIRKAFRDDKSKKFGINEIFFEPSIKVWYGEGKPVENVKRVLLFWRTESSETERFKHKVTVEIWPIYDILADIKKAKNKSFIHEFLNIAEKYRTYCNNLFGILLSS